MRGIFGKRLPFFLALIIFQVIVILIVLIWTVKDVSGLFKSVYDFISKSPVALNILGFIADYAEFITGFVVLITLFIILISLKKYQRGRAINRLHNWARNGVVILAQYRQENADASQSRADRYEEVRIMIDKLITNSSFALTDARTFHGEINVKTRRTVEALQTIRKKLVNEDESLFDDLQVLQHDFADVMILAFEFIK
jgi:hypothetical protein